MATGRALVVAVASAILLMLPSSAMALCDLFEPPVQCEARKLAQLRAEWERAAEEQQELNRLRIQVSNNIVNARAQFWATYPDKPGVDKAQTEFAHWLWTKDIIYLRQNLQSPVLKDSRGRSSSIEAAKAKEALLSVPIDGGIPQTVTPEFEDWVNAVRKKVFEGHTSNSTDDAFMQGFLSAWMGQKFWDALASAEKEYQTYVMARDWLEFDRAHRVPAGFDKPETYGIYLYSRFHHLQVQAAAANYKKMTELLGAPRVQAAAKRVMDAPKRDDGGLVVTSEATKKGPGGGEMIDYDKPAPADPIGAFADPVRVMEMLATQDDDRRYLLDLLHRHAPDLRKLDPATTWTWADSAYKRLVLAFGEQELLAASHAVRLAPKRLYSGGVITVNELGVKRTEPIETVEDLLVMKDPRGYVKAALIFSKDLDTATAADAAYKAYVAARGEPAVLDAARRRAGNKPQLTFKPELEFIDAEMATPTVTPIQGPQKDSPQYSAWKRFAPGASASYINRNLGQVSLRRPGLEGGTVGIRSRYLLRSITPDRADLYMTEIAYDPPPQSTAHPPRDTEMAYPARLDATPTARDAAVARTPLQSGDETLVINGKQIATHWQAEQMPGADQMAKGGCGPMIVTTWRSDAVPGGLVRETTDQMCRDNRYPPGSDNIIRRVRETLLESFETSGSPSATRPIQPAAGIAPILPLPVQSSLPDQPSTASIAQPAPSSAAGAPAAARGVDRRVFDPNMRSTGPGAPAATPSSAAAPSFASRVADGITVPAGTLITVMTNGTISAATNRPGDNFRGTILQPVVVNGMPAIAGNTTVTLQVVAAGDGLSVQLAGITGNSGIIPASSSQVALDPQSAAANAAIERTIAAAAAANPRAAAMTQALAARLVVVSGPRMNLPSGARLTFTLAAPVTIDGRK
jgi:hypothetical protein